MSARPISYGPKQLAMEIYAGIWGRTPDWEGADYWTQQLISGSMSRVDIATSFFDQPLVKSQYAGLSGDDFLEALYLNIFNVAEPDAEGFAYWQGKIEEDPSLLSVNIGTLVIQMIDGMWGNPEAADTHALYKNFVLSGERFVDAQKAAGVRAFNHMNSDEREAFLDVAATLREGITATTTSSQIDTLIASAMQSLGYDAGQPGGPSQTLYLTEGRDTPETLVASNSDTKFIGDVVQNLFGAQVNTLGTGDRLDGRGGNNSLQAQVTEGAFMGGGNMPIQPVTHRIQDIKLEALNAHIGGTFANPNSNSEVYVNAKNMHGIDKIGSWYSNANLTIKDLTTKDDNGVARPLESMTIGMEYTGNGDSRWQASDLHVFFDQDYLVPTLDRGVERVVYRLLNEDWYDQIANPNGGIALEPLNAVAVQRLEFAIDWSNGNGTNETRFTAFNELLHGLEIATPGNVFVTVQDLANFLNIAAVPMVRGDLTAAEAAQAWFDFAGRPAGFDTHVSQDDLTALLSNWTQTLQQQDAIWSTLDLSFSVGQPFLADISPVSGAQRIGTDLVLEVPAAQLVRPGTTDSFGTLRTEDAWAVIEPVERINLQNHPTVIDRGITDPRDLNSNRFERASREEAEQSQDLIINVDLEKVGRASDGGELIIGGMSKTNANVWDAGSGSKGIDIFNITVHGGADKPSSLSSLASTNNSLREVYVSTAAANANNPANLTIGNTNTANNYAGDGISLKDVRVLDTTQFLGDFTLRHAEITRESIAKYMDLRDRAPNQPQDDNVFFTYHLGDGDDFLALNVNWQVLAREDFRLDIQSGAGNDRIILNENYTAGYTANRLVNQQLNDNIAIHAGDGDNFVNTWGAGNARITTGSNDDVIKTDNSGAKAQFIFNSVAGFRGDGNELSNSGVLDSSRGNDQVQTFNFFKGTVQVTFQGIETRHIEIPSTGYTSSTLQINQAIKKAINDDPVLSKVLDAKDGPGNTLLVESRIDGRMVFNDLDVTLFAPLAYNANPTAAERALMAEGRLMLNSGDLAAADRSHADINTAVDNARPLYDTAFVMSGQRDPVVFEQSINFAGFQTSDDHIDPVFSGSNIIEVGGIRITLQDDMSSAQIAQAVATALQGAINASGGAARLSTSDGYHYLNSATVNGSVVNLQFIEGIRVPFGDRPGTVTVGRVDGAEDAYLSTTNPQDGGGMNVSSAAPLAATGGTTAWQTTTFDFANSKIAVNGGGQFTLSSDLSGLPAVGPASTTVVTPLNIAVTVANGDGPLAIANKVAAAVNLSGEGWATVRGTQVEIRWFEESAPTQTEVGKGNHGTVSIAAGSATLAAGSSLPSGSSTAYASTVITPATGTLTQTINTSGMEVTEAGTLTIAGRDIALDYGDNDLAIADKIAQALNGQSDLLGGQASVTATANGAVVTVTQTATAGSVAVNPIVNVFSDAKFAAKQLPSVVTNNWTWSLNEGAIQAGTNSTAESDNVINAGNGQDVIVLGTGAYSNDTIVLAGNFGRNTIFNYDGNSSSTARDYIDVSAYGIRGIIYDAKTPGKFVMDQVQAASGQLNNDAVVSLEVNAADFARLSGELVRANLNGTATATDNIAGLPSSVNAQSGLNAASNYVLMVHNSENPGEYKLFHLTAAAGANNNQFATATAIGVLDFGTNNFAAPGPITPPAVSPWFNWFSINQLNEMGNVSLPYSLHVSVSGTETLAAHISSASMTFHMNGGTVNLTGSLRLNGDLTVNSGTLNTTAGQISVAGSITVNSALVVTAAQAMSFVHADVLFSSLTGQGQLIIDGQALQLTQMPQQLQFADGKFSFEDVIEPPGSAVLVVDSITPVPADVKAGEAFDVVVELQNTGDAAPVGLNAVLTVNNVNYGGIINGLQITFPGVTVDEAAEEVALDVTVRADNAQDVSSSTFITVLPDETTVDPAVLSVAIVDVSPAEPKADEEFSVTVEVTNLTPENDPGAIRVTLTLNGTEIPDVDVGPDNRAVFSGLTKPAGDYTLTASVSADNGAGEPVVQAITVLPDDVIPPVEFDDIITVADLQTYDAAAGNIKYVLDFNGGVNVATIQNFSAGDAIDMSDAPDGSGMVVDTTGTTELNIAFGDVTNFTNTWVLNFHNVDAALVAAVEANEGNLDAQVNLISAQWADWLIDSDNGGGNGGGGTPGEFDNSIIVVDLQTYDAATGNNEYVLSFNGGVNVATIQNFSAGDAINISAEPAGSGMVIDTTGTTELNIAFGDVTNFTNTWVLNFHNVDAALVAAVEANEGNLDAQIQLIAAQWTSDWLIAA
ncbi:DUF4214 domain-containing protein [Thiorhodospira sibirica]|uniref:DUF4214 domain-containing protein n=1 Tax=Thiorhodospira sibirica TaxID=154347 RepID=UPI00022C5DA1|nr:DUF4214 domain-containing protein [Thiorhodospira sibirica]